MFVGILSREPNIICLVLAALNFLSRNVELLQINNSSQEFVNAEKCSILTCNNTTLTFQNSINYFTRISNRFYFFQKIENFQEVKV